MAVAVSGALRPIAKFEVANIPVGKALVLSAAMGVGDVAKAVTTQVSGGKIPQWLGGLGVAWALMNVKALKGMLGADIAELAALAVLSDTIDDQIDVRAKTSTFLGGLFGKVVVSKSPPVIQDQLSAAQVAQANVAAIMGATGRGLGV